MSKKGFSLFDLLILIAIIAILAAILLPALASARQKARSTKCMGNLKQLGCAIHTYSSDNNEKFPAIEGIITGDSTSNTPIRAMASLSILYPRYISDGRLFICPSANDAKALETDPKITPLLQKLFTQDKAAIAQFTAAFNSTHSDYGYDPTHCAHHKPGVAIMADQPARNIKSNSPNHRGQGQNVLYVDGSVAWYNKSNCGYLEDEIYSSDKPAHVESDADNSNIM